MLTFVKSVLRTALFGTSGALVLLLLPPPLAAQSVAEGPVAEVTVFAGEHERIGTVVSFALPEGAGDGAYHLEDAAGQTLPLQVDAERQAWFVLDRLEAGAERTYRLIPSDVSPNTDVQVVRGEGDLPVLVRGDTLLVYRPDVDELPRSDIPPVYARGGYIHPLYSPSGKLVTDHYPPDHVHHQGLWSAWTRTSFEGREPDFWNMGDSTGTVLPEGLDTTWGGPVQGGFVARHRFVDLSADEPTDVLEEVWQVRAYATSDQKPPYYLFDLKSTQEAASESPLELPEYHYGGVALRGHRTWNGEGNARFLTSEGQGRLDGNETKARWVHLGGLVDGDSTGVAVLSHPENFRAPQPVRLHPSEPYFVFAPQQEGPFAIQPGEAYVAQYRYVVLDGPPNAAMLDRLWNDYAHPPEVTVTSE